MFRKGDAALVRSSRQLVTIDKAADGQAYRCRLPRRFVRVTGVNPEWNGATAGYPVVGSIGEIISFRSEPPATADGFERETVAFWGGSSGRVHLTRGDYYDVMDEDSDTGRRPIRLYMRTVDLEPIPEPVYLKLPEGKYADEYGDYIEDEEEELGRPQSETAVFCEDDLQMAHPTCLKTIEAAPVDRMEELRAQYPQEPKGSYLPFEDVDKLEKLLDEKVTKHDLNGHFENTKDKHVIEAVFERRGMLCIRTEDGNKLLAILTGEAQTEGEWFKLGNSMWFSGVCSTCSATDFALETDGTTVRVVGEVCPYANGYPPTKLELNVPSGKMVVGGTRSLGHLFPVMAEGDRSEGYVNQSAVLRDLANVGLMSGYCGQCWPSLFRTAVDTFDVVYDPSRYNEEANEEIARNDHSKGERSGFKPTPLRKPKGTQVMGLGEFGFNVCDFDEHTRRVARFAPGQVESSDLDDGGFRVVDVTPGVYEFTFHHGRRDRDGKHLVIFAEIRRLRDPDPVRDFLTEFDNVSTTAAQWVQAQAITWPTLFGIATDRREKVFKVWEDMTPAEQTSCWQRVADHTLCVIGGGTAWHEKGFPLGKIPPGTKDFPVPKFRYQTHWYPMSEGYGGICETLGVGESRVSRPEEYAKYLAPSFATLASEVLESMISFGLDVQEDHTCGREVERTRDVMRLALRAYRALADTKHGDHYLPYIDPEYVAWVNDGDRADKWVENFDLGPAMMDRHHAAQKGKRRLPDDVQYVEFDARNHTASGHYAWHPKNPGVAGCWANKNDAQCFAIPFCTELWVNKDNGIERGWQGHAGKSIPLYTVARVVRTGFMTGMGEWHIEIQFDYGSEWMLDTSVRKALTEQDAPRLRGKPTAWETALPTTATPAMRVITEEEYNTLLPQAVAFYEASEAVIAARIQKEKRR